MPHGIDEFTIVLPEWTDMARLHGGVSLVSLNQLGR